MNYLSKISLRLAAIAALAGPETADLIHLHDALQ